MSNQIPTVAFVILHYLSFDTTVACVDSILALAAQWPQVSCSVVVVDNASPNDSCAGLRERYAGEEHIIILQNEENLGFARGNNVGYRYALEHLQPDFIVIANNDTIFRQEDFFIKLSKSYAAHPAALIGPDILNIGGYHQNPYRDHMITDAELSRWIRNRTLWLWFLRIDSLLHLSEHFGCIRRIYDRYERHSAAGRPNEIWQREAEGVVLQGACIIFTREYMVHCPEYAFYPETYMYCEEDILAWLCMRDGLTVRYEPRLQVLHAESAATSRLHVTAREKELFLTTHIVRSLRVYRRLRK